MPSDALEPHLRSKNSPRRIRRKRAHASDYNGCMRLPFFLPQRFLPNHGFRFEQRPNACGFTLVEILVVIVILGILAALVVPRVLERPDEARVIAAKNDVAEILQATQLSRLDSGRYPTGEQGLAALVTKPSVAPIPPNWKPNGYL